MKKILIVVIAVFAIYVHVNGQLTFKMNSFSASVGEQLVVPVKVARFDSIISLQGSITFDTSVIKFVSLQQMGLPGMNGTNFGTNQANNGKVTYLWTDGSFNGVHLADSAVIFAIKFNVTGNLGTESQVTFNNTPTQQEVIDVNFNTVIPNYVDGRIIINNILGTRNPGIIEGNNFTIYPNPNNGITHIYRSQPYRTDCYFEVYNYFGQSIIQNTLTNCSTISVIDLNKYGKGIYIIRITDGTNTSTGKIIVE